MYLKPGGRCPNCDFSFASAALQFELHRAVAAARMKFAALLRTIGTWLLLIVAALLIVTDSFDEASRALERQTRSRSISQKSSAASEFPDLE